MFWTPKIRLLLLSNWQPSWGKIKGRQTPQPSLISSDDKGSVDYDASNNDDNDEVASEHGIAHGVLVFGDEFNTEDSGGESDTDDA